MSSKLKTQNIQTWVFFRKLSYSEKSMSYDKSDPLYFQAVNRGGGEGVQLLVDGEDHLPQGVEVAKDVET